MCLWDTDAGQMLHKISVPQERLLVDYRLDFTPSGTIIAATDGLSLFAWTFTPGKVPKSVKESSSAVYPTALAFSPDGAVLALGGADHNVHMLDATAHPCIREDEGLSSGLATPQRVFARAQLPLAGPSARGCARVFDGEQGTAWGVFLVNLCTAWGGFFVNRCIEWEGVVVKAGVCLGKRGDF